MKPGHGSKAGQRGITLIEILVAIVVLSVGLLGLAGLQLKGMQVNQGSTFRWQAAMLAEDLADRIRADRTNASNGLYSGTYTAGAAPTGSAAAATDWAARLAALPKAKAIVGAPTLVTAGATTYSVSIEVDWVDVRANAGAGTTSTTAATFSPGAFVLPTEFTL